MKSKEELIIKGKPGTVGGEITFDFIKNTYEKCIKEIEKAKEKIEEYNKMMGQSRNISFKSIEEASIIFASLINKYDLYKFSDGESEFTIGDCYELNSTIEYLLYKGTKQDFLKRGFDLTEISYEIRENNKEFNEYLELSSTIDGWYKKMRYFQEKIKLRDIDDNEHYHEQCMNENHYYIDLGDELRCAYCGFTTKDYDLSQEDLDFLKTVATQERLILEEATQEDLPFIQVVVDEQAKELKQYEEALFNDEDQEDKLEHFSGYTEDLSTILRLRLKTAHKMDKKDYYNEFYEVNMYDPKYYTYEEAKDLVEKVNKEIKETTDEEKIKELKIKRYELLILSGIPLKEMFGRIKNESDKDCFIIAYSNMSNNDYRKESGYFYKGINKSNVVTDGISYTCLTADPEINKRLLKIRTNN